VKREGPPLWLGQGQYMRELDPLACEPPFGLEAGVSAKPNLTGNRPAENFNLAFSSSSHSFLLC
jgi:hypothetical protein